MTLMELLVVMAIILILAALLLAALGRAKDSGKGAGCLSNLRQFAVACQLYAPDNGGKLVQNVSEPVLENSASPNCWVYGDMKSPGDSTNLELLRSGQIFAYIAQTAVYRCPADVSFAPLEQRAAPRVRSYSMNSWMGSTEMEIEEPEAGWRTFLRESDLAAAGPARIWVILDEHIGTLSDGWYVVTMDDSSPFERFPATRHNNSYCLNFADGHAETYHLLKPSNHIPELPAMAFAAPLELSILPNDPDWMRLRAVTTTR
jgi:type II secretory pathway pseudopilin PulG